MVRIGQLQPLGEINRVAATFPPRAGETMNEVNPGIVATAAGIEAGEFITQGFVAGEGDQHPVWILFAHGLEPEGGVLRIIKDVPRADIRLGGTFAEGYELGRISERRQNLWAFEGDVLHRLFFLICWRPLRNLRVFQAAKWVGFAELTLLI